MNEHGEAIDRVYLLFSVIFEFIHSSLSNNISYNKDEKSFQKVAEHSI